MTAILTRINFDHKTLPGLPSKEVFIDLQNVASGVYAMNACLNVGWTDKSAHDPNFVFALNAYGPAGEILFRARDIFSGAAEGNVEEFKRHLSKWFDTQTHADFLHQLHDELAEKVQTYFDNLPATPARKQRVYTP